MRTNKYRVLFVCVHNSFRSQIAEAIMNYKYGNIFEAESAGLSLTEINPLAIEVMKEYGIDISANSVDSVFDFLNEGRLYSYVITVCSREAESACPVFPGIRKRIHWDLEDPEAFTGTDEEKYQKAIQLRSKIEKRIDDFAR